MREWQVKRRERTRQLIELGGLVVKAGLVELADDDRATLYGAFLTVGYSRPFPVTDEYAPPFPAPASFDSVTISTGPPPPFDLDAELARVMRHQ